MLEVCAQNKNETLLKGLFLGKKNSTNTMTDILKQIVENLSNVKLSNEQAIFLSNLFINERNLNAIEGATSINGRANTEDLKNVLKEFQTNSKLISPNNEEETNLYIENIIDDLPNSEYTTNNEFSTISNDKDNIPDSIEDKKSEDVFTITNPSLRRKLLEEKFVDFSNSKELTCPFKIITASLKINHSCSIVLDLKKNIKIKDLSNSMFLYSLFSFLFCVFSLTLVQFFT